MLFEVKDLFASYGISEVVKGVSFNLDEGEVISIIGANGAGKSTLMKLISGLKKPSSGEIWWRGKRIDGMPAYKVLKEGISLIPAGRMIFAPLTVLENLQLGAYTKSNKTEIANRLEIIYSHFPVLKNRPNQIAGSLSGGEQQMLAVARGLMSEPKVLLMDEPSVGLSPLLTAEVMKIILDIKATGISIILVEQNARMALKFSERAYVLQVGKIVLEGDSEKLINDERVIQAYLGGKKN
ncbi:MAG: ABC transporter ATP-binding protein [Clostridiales Family XIII bacterium]|jgi:branched-chain amino acid transport system ATP-binding protein|nr:ABC transporter ATP-binding protein [Clostridiales Family XIII bacterium]